MRPLDVNRVDLSFVNVFDAHYHLSSVSADVMTSTSYAFSFYSNNVISEINTGNFTTAIREVVCRQVTVIPKCEDITPVIIRQEGQFLNKRWETRVDYYLRYKGKIVNSASWPKLNTTSLQEYVRDELNLTTESGLRYVITPSLPAGSLDYRYHFSLFMKTKVAYADFTKFASSIKETWLSAHSEYRGCGCIKVSVSNTEELLSEGGERYWKLVYYMNVNGTVVSPGDTQPLNVSLLNQHVTFTGPQGAYVIVPENFYSFRAYDFRYSNALYLHTWVSKEDYHRFEKTLTEYYLTRLSGSHTEEDIHVTVNGIRQTTTPDGRLVWKLVYFVNVKNKLVYTEYIPSVSYSSLSSRISFKTPTGLSYKLFSGNVKHLWPATSFFRFYLNHPIAPDIWGRLRHSILQAYYTQYPDFRDCDCVQVEFPKHQDELITETGESVWRVGYRIKLNGVLVDAETTPLTAIHYLQDKLTFSGPNGIKYKVTANVKKSMMAQSAFSVFLNHYVSQESLEAVGMSIKKTWATVNGGLDIDKLKVTFIRQKEYTDTEGNPRWKFEYSLNYNNTVIHSGDWQKINVTVLHENLVGVKTPNGEGFSAVSQDVSVIEYRQQFTLFATTKVATESFAELESQLIEAWEEKNEAWKACSCVEIANIRQEEVLDNRG
ncbi:uncharacterized protein LOC135471678 [Liolophura sinensis]|uniref:uncharacterized protein LOC135471678 n=1 Tax=Liolophura sinensis TaxID=3198878 RepID=UPI0031581041